jgi:UDP-N-acetylmuramate dehydrogenase
MNIQNNVNLSSFTTLKIGGNAKNLYEPESVEEFIKLLESIGEEKVYILGGGSNLLINDKKTFDRVICTKRMTSIFSDLEGNVIVEAGTRNQKLINYLLEKGLGGIEYLSSVPGTIGGAICMNAGTGIATNKYIGDHVISVDVYSNGTIKTLSRKECEFGFRDSLIKRENLVVLKVAFRFPKVDQTVSREIIKQHLESVRKYHDLEKPNVGSVFNKFNPFIINVARKLQLGFPKGVRFSKKTSDWIVNNGKGKYRQALFLINFIKFIHKILFLKVNTEIIIWR